MSAPPAASAASYVAPEAAATTSLILYVDKEIRSGESSVSHVSGSVAAASPTKLTYADENALAYYLASARLKNAPDHIGFILTDPAGDVIDRVIPGATKSPILDGTNWKNFPTTDAGVAGCGAGRLVLDRFLDIPGVADIVLLVNTDEVYRGRIMAPPLAYYDDDLGMLEEAVYEMQGWKAYAGDIYVYGQDFEDEEVSEIIKTLAQAWVADVPVTYDASRIEVTSYTASKMAFDSVTYAQAFDSLTALAGSYTWGVDVDGVFYFIEIETAASRHYWLEQHDVQIERLESDPSNIKNAITVESTAISGGSIERVTVEDAASIATYRRREARITYPFSRTPVTVQAISSLTGSPALTNPSYATDSSSSTAATQAAGINDYIEFDIVASCNQIILTQGEYPSFLDGIVEDLELWDYTATPALIEAKSGLATTGSWIFSVRANATYRLIVKSAVVGGGDWNITTLTARLGGTVDLEQFGASQLAALKDPVKSGDISLPSNIWESPPFAMRITDYLGTSEVYQVAHVMHKLAGGLERIAEVGQGQLELKAALADQKSQIETETTRAKKAEAELAANISDQGTDLDADITDLQSDISTLQADVAAAAGQDFHSFTSGTLSASQELLHVQMAREVTFRGGASGVSEALTAATGATVLSIRQQTVAGGTATQIGTITYAGAGTVGTVLIDSDAGTGGDQDAVFSVGDILTVIGPGVADATLAGITVTLIGEWT